MTELETFMIEQACLKLMARYNVALDAEDYEGFVSVFTEDAVWGRPPNPHSK